MSWVPLKSHCPRQCACGSKSIKNWCHAQCRTTAYLNNQGDISCAKGCNKYFIQHACFKCEQSNQWEQHKSASQFSMALSSALTSANFSLNDQQKLQFITTLNQQVILRWNR